MYLNMLILLISLLKATTTKTTTNERGSIDQVDENLLFNFGLELSDSFVLEQRSSLDFKNARQKFKHFSNKETIPKKEGEFCRRSFDGRGGYCTLAHKCLHVMREHRKHGIKVDFCAYHKNIPVICCPLEDKHVVKNRISAAKCKEYHSDVSNLQLMTPRKISGSRCVSSVPMIVGGEPTKMGNFPHMAALGWTQSDNTVQWGCGGFLISEQFVVTAAHCATSNSKPMDIVRLGATQLNETNSRYKRDIKILLVIVPPNYNSSAYYDDIALMKLTRRVRFNDRIRPACLWPQPEIPTKTIIATGWGRTKFMGPQSNHLLKVDLNVFDHRVCREIYQKERRLSYGIVDHQFCAGHLAGEKDTCQGDSGGPVHIEIPEYNCVKFVVGVTSFGKFCAAPNAPGVYTKIYSYIDWIEDVVFRSRLEKVFKN